MIIAEGLIKAGYVHTSKISCMGNLIVIKEMVDSEAILEGRLEMPKGRLFSSTISARGGARIFQAGSEKARPSDIRVGTSAVLEAERNRVEANVRKYMLLFEEASVKKRQAETESEKLKLQLESYRKSRQRTLTVMEKMEHKPGSAPELFDTSLEETEDKIREIEE